MSNLGSRLRRDTNNICPEFRKKKINQYVNSPEYKAELDALRASGDEIRAGINPLIYAINAGREASLNISQHDFGQALDHFTSKDECMTDAVDVTFGGLLKETQIVKPVDKTRSRKDNVINANFGPEKA